MDSQRKAILFEKEITEKKIVFVRLESLGYKFVGMSI